MNIEPNNQSLANVAELHQQAHQCEPLVHWQAHWHGSHLILFQVTSTVQESQLPLESLFTSQSSMVCKEVQTVDMGCITTETHQGHEDYTLTQLTTTRKQKLCHNFNLVSLS